MFLMASLRSSADILVRKIGELGQDQKPVELTKLLNFATFDIMADLCFGSPLGLLEKNEFSPVSRVALTALCQGAV